MNFLQEERVSCPYCGEHIVVLIDPEDTEEEYIEDCQVCCRPISFNIAIESNGELVANVRAENE